MPLLLLFSHIYAIVCYYLINEHIAKKEYVREKEGFSMSDMKEKLHTGELYLPGDEDIIKEQVVYQDLLCD